MSWQPIMKLKKHMVFLVTGRGTDAEVFDGRGRRGCGIKTVDRAGAAHKAVK